MLIPHPFAFQSEKKTREKERERKNPTNSVWLHFDPSVSLCPLGYRVHVNVDDEGASLLRSFQWKVLRLIKKNPHVTPDFYFLGNTDQNTLVVRWWLFWRNARG